MSNDQIDTSQLDEIIKRLEDYPKKQDKVIFSTVRAALHVFNEFVPPYPTPPAGSTYTRTGQLGRSLGSSISGGKAGAPSIFKIKKMGAAGYVEGRFGTNLGYAPYVIGDDRKPHFSHWWKMSDIPARAANKINGLFKAAVDKVALWLEGKARI